MGKDIEKSIGNTLTRLHFRDGSGITIGFLDINLEDTRLISRIGDFADYFKNYNNTASVDAAAEEQFCKLLGYDCKSNLFGILRPTSKVETGEMFAAVILRTITEEFIKTARKAIADRIAAMKKHTEAYENENV